MTEQELRDLILEVFEKNAALSNIAIRRIREIQQSFVETAKEKGLIKDEGEGN